MGDSADRQAMLDRRYGRERRPRWPVAVAVVVVLAALAWLGWAIWGQTDRQVTSALLSYDTRAHTSTARIQISLRDTDVRATCLVQAQAEDHSVVGELHFRAPRDRGTGYTITRTLRTERPATAVVLVGCTAPGQNRPH